MFVCVKDEARKTLVTSLAANIYENLKSNSNIRNTINQDTVCIGNRTSFCRKLSIFNFSSSFLICIIS